MLDRVSYHAVIRYLDRVLGLPVDEWLVGMDHLAEDRKARLCCQRAGLPVDAVRNAILSPIVFLAVRSGISGAVKHDGFVFVLQRGSVLTVMPQRMYVRTMGSRYGSPREHQDRSKKRRKERRRLLALAEVE
ncbi:hypothetical protein J2T08_000544 [Neorhizobium galegae]|uniref:hypothetical protein n=1 Tax=Neorhizobium galegae TaxID=399 RepID=UPI002788D28E|nr:hypothetical protein [Neorhizobium galegae]MDQ0132643.1 hypothetical protein [Neorhizobium galegae]